MTLLQGNIGKNYIIRETSMERSIERRLETMGLTAGATIQILNRKKNGSLILKIRGTRLAVGSGISAGIYVYELEYMKGGKQNE